MMVKKTFVIPDMHCSNCVMRLEGLEDELPGIRRIRGSYHRQTLEVEFDETQVSEERLRAAIARLGYTAQE
jgi:copper chaperone CopZ|uniref:Copper chaperone n=1 Tax=Anaerolinea thermolimosa TaxID=229919 RepID=A0A7C4PM18_9CHLR